PILAAVSTSSRPPACDTTPRAPTPNPILATRPLRFTPEVPFRSRDLCLWLDTASLAERHFPHIHPGAPPQDHETARPWRPRAPQEFTIHNTGITAECLR